LSRPKPIIGQPPGEIGDNYVRYLAMNICPKCQRQLPQSHDFCPYDGTPLRVGAAEHWAGARPEQPADPMLGTEVARRYRVESLLHEREACRTYEATCLRTDRLVALILPSQRLWEDQAALQRFFRGARAASGLKHPGIISVDDVGETPEGIPFLVTELARGTTVSAMLADQGRLSLLRVVNIARSVAQALAAAHKKGVAQWDLSPSHVLVVSRSGGPDQVRLLDLGLTRLLQPTGRATQVADELRTQPYAAPRAAVAAHVPLDVLAFGGLLFSMATGQAPEGGKADEQVLQAALDERQGTGSERRARQQMAELTLRCLADSPAARPRSMDEIDRRLGRIEDSVGLGLMERSLLEPGSAPGGRPRRASSERLAAPMDEETADGVPVELINTIERVKEVVSAGEPRSPATGGHRWLTRQVAIVAIAVALFVTGLAIGLLINR
jgi:serine/threonine-protein kinase